MKLLPVIFLLSIISVSLFGCAAFSNSSNEPIFNKSYNQCSTFKVTGDNMIYKNLTIYANDGNLYFKTPKLNDPSGIKVYAIANDHSLALVQYSIINSQSEFTIFKTGEGFAGYALKAENGGSVYIKCTQN